MFGQVLGRKHSFFREKQKLFLPNSEIDQKYLDNRNTRGSTFQQLSKH